jgi:hypothetical protein
MHSRRGDGQPPGDADKSSREEEGAHARGRLTASSRDGHREKLGWEKKRTRFDFPTAGDMRRGRRITFLSHDATHGLVFSAPFGRTRALDGWLSPTRQAHALSVAAAAAAALAAAVMTPTSSVMNSGCAVLWMEWAAPSNLRTAQPGSRAWDENSRPEAAATSASSTHAPPAPGQAQGGLQPRPASAYWQMCSSGPGPPALPISHTNTYVYKGAPAGSTRRGRRSTSTPSTTCAWSARCATTAASRSLSAVAIHAVEP